MGHFIKGQWHLQDVNPNSPDGEFKRRPSTFLDAISTAPNARFTPEKGRYTLYISLACPWAHRTLIYWTLKDLHDYIELAVVHYHMGPQGWIFSDGPNTTPDPNLNASSLGELYLKADPQYTGRVTVPILWDKHEQTIVNNESSQIIRFFNHAFDSLTGNTLDFYPDDLCSHIEDWNQRLYEPVNNGVYKAGFSRTQEAYNTHVEALFKALDDLDTHLSEQPFLCGDRITEADWRLFPTLYRFDPVYVGHFKCNLKRILDYPNLSRYVQTLYDYPGIAATCDLTHIKGHYYGSHPTLNPSGIIPLGPSQYAGQPTAVTS